MNDAAPSSPEAQIDAAREARRRGDRAGALALFRDALARRPNHRGLPVDIAEELRALDRLDEADAMLHELLAKHPDTAAAWVGLGRSARRRGDHEAALAHFRRGHELKPDHPTAAQDILQELGQLGRMQEARPLIEEAVRSGHATAAIHHRLGLQAIAEKDGERALSCFEDGIRLQADHPGCHAAFIHECVRTNQLERAAAALERARASIGQRVAQVEVAAVRLAIAQGQLDAALERARTLRTYFPDDTALLHLLIDLSLRTAAFDAAGEAIDALPAGNDLQRAQQLIARARLARARYDFTEGLRLLDEAQALAPTLQGILPLQLILLQSDSDPEGARRAIAAHQTQATGANTEVPRLRQGLQKELEVNPFAARAVAAIRQLPLAERPAALGQALQDEPNYFGSALALLVTLNRLGAWEHATPLPDAPKRSRIPPRIVQFWDSPDIPDDILQAMQSWPRTCLGFEHQVFNDHSAAAFLAAECAPEVLRAFQRSNHPAMRADIFRLAYLSVRGGIYNDADDMCRHSLRPWLKPGLDLLLLQEDIGSIGNNFLAAAPGHPLIAATLATIVRNVLERQGEDIWFLTGPGALTQQFCTLYLDDLALGRLPAGIAVRDYYHSQQLITAHLPRSYKQDKRHWVSEKAAGTPLFRTVLSAGAPVRLRIRPPAAAGDQPASPPGTGLAAPGEARPR